MSDQLATNTGLTAREILIIRLTKTIRDGMGPDDKWGTAVVTMRPESIRWTPTERDAYDAAARSSSFSDALNAALEVRCQSIAEAVAALIAPEEEKT